MAMVREMIHPDDRDHVYRADEEADRIGVHSKAEHRVVRSDGEVRTVQGLVFQSSHTGTALELLLTNIKRKSDKRLIGCHRP